MRDACLKSICNYSLIFIVAENDHIVAHSPIQCCKSFSGLGLRSSLFFGFRGHHVPFYHTRKQNAMFQVNKDSILQRCVRNRTDRGLEL